MIQIISPTHLHRALSGLPFPSTRQKIVEYVQYKDSDNGIFAAMEQLPEDSYRNEASIFEALYLPTAKSGMNKSSTVPVAIDIPQDIRIHERLLIIAAGTQSARIYEQDGKQIVLIESIKIPTHKFSDREGHFKVRSSGNTVRSGAPHENNRDHAKSLFHRELTLALSKIDTNGLSHVFILAPSQDKHEIFGALPSTLQHIAHIAHESNSFGSHPLSLLQTIHKHSFEQQPNCPEKKEARKILETSVLARNVIRGS